jgi:hypothetical protein
MANGRLLELELLPAVRHRAHPRALRMCTDSAHRIVMGTSDAGTHESGQGSATDNDGNAGPQPRTVGAAAIARYTTDRTSTSSCKAATIDDPRRSGRERRMELTGDPYI